MPPGWAIFPADLPLTPNSRRQTISALAESRSSAYPSDGCPGRSAHQPASAGSLPETVKVSSTRYPDRSAAAGPGAASESPAEGPRPSRHLCSATDTRPHDISTASKDGPDKDA